MEIGQAISKNLQAKTWKEKKNNRGKNERKQLGLPFPTVDLKYVDYQPSFHIIKKQFTFSIKTTVLNC